MTQSRHWADGLPLIFGVGDLARTVNGRSQKRPAQVDPHRVEARGVPRTSFDTDQMIPSFSAS
jgi:hypothetical protein